jgi:hypothetical protein
MESTSRGEGLLGMSRPGLHVCDCAPQRKVLSLGDTGLLVALFQLWDDPLAIYARENVELSRVCWLWWRERRVRSGCANQWAHARRQGATPVS